jgi:hypothetical protein
VGAGVIRDEFFDDTVREFINLAVIGFDFSFKLFDFGVEMVELFSVFEGSLFIDFGMCGIVIILQVKVLYKIPKRELNLQVLTEKKMKSLKVKSGSKMKGIDFSYIDNS